MRLVQSNLLLFAACLSVTVVTSMSSELGEDKTSKHFSLFSVVQFENAQCTSDTSVAGGATDGTCYTSTECSNKGGTKAGKCASGFGTCCVFINNAAAATSTITENRTRLRNKEYPSIATTATAVELKYTVNKLNSDICQLRLDFTKFIIAGPSNTQESIPATKGTHCQDSFAVTTTDNANWYNTNTARLCGKLTGEHLYVDLSATATDAALLTFNTATAPTPAVAKRLWDIKVSQIECFASYRAPPGCQRYFTSDYGKIISYNFAKDGTTAQGAAGSQNAGLELALQRVNTCIRRSKGMCCVEYQLCAKYDSIALVDATGTAAGTGEGGTTNEAWTIDMITYPFVIDAIQVNIGMVDSMCFGDYVEIPSSWSASCGAGTSSARTQINTRYCGVRFGENGQKSIAAQVASMPVCDCSEPFVVRHSSDDANDKAGKVGLGAAGTVAGTANPPRGFCLDFKQIPCWQ